MKDGSGTFLVRWFTPTAEGSSVGTARLRPSVPRLGHHQCVLRRHKGRQSFVQARISHAVFHRGPLIRHCVPGSCAVAHLTPDDSYKQRFAEALGKEEKEVVELS